MSCDTCKNYAPKETQETPKSRHRKGERCDLPVYEDTRRHLPDEKHHFEYQECQHKVREGDWFVADSGECIIQSMGASYGIREILRLVIDKPEAKPVMTKVTVWMGHPVDQCVLARLRNLYSTPYATWVRGQYSFKGKPDIDRIIRETLERGALAVKVECSDRFKIMNWALVDCVVITSILINIRDRGGVVGNYCFYSNISRTITDSDIDAAASSFLASKQPKAPEFKVGDIVTGERGTGIVEDVGTTLIGVRLPDGGYDGREKCLYRLASPAEGDSFKDAKYTRWYGKLGIRAYKRPGYKYLSGECLWYTRSSRVGKTGIIVFDESEFDDLCAALSLPIYTLKEGEEPVYPLPRGEK